MSVWPSIKYRQYLFNIVKYELGTSPHPSPPLSPFTFILSSTTPVINIYVLSWIHYQAPMPFISWIEGGNYHEKLRFLCLHRIAQGWVGLSGGIPSSRLVYLIPEGFLCEEHTPASQSHGTYTDSSSAPMPTTCPITAAPGAALAFPAALCVFLEASCCRFHFSTSTASLLLASQSHFLSEDDPFSQGSPPGAFAPASRFAIFIITSLSYRCNYENILMRL